MRQRYPGCSTASSHSIPSRNCSSTTTKPMACVRARGGIRGAFRILNSSATKRALIESRLSHRQMAITRPHRPFQRPHQAGCRLLFAVVAWAYCGQVRGAIDFEKEIQPIIESACLHCHNEAKAEGEIRLDSLAGAVANGEKEPAIVPGDAAQSPFYTCTVLAAGDDQIMPPDGPPWLKRRQAGYGSGLMKARSGRNPQNSKSIRESILQKTCSRSSRPTAFRATQVHNPRVS